MGGGKIKGDVARNDTMRDSSGKEKLLYLCPINVDKLTGHYIRILQNVAIGVNRVNHIWDLSALCLTSKCKATISQNKSV